MKTISPGQHLFVASWGRDHIFRVNTLDNFFAQDAISNPTRAAEHMARARARGDDAAWTVKEPAVLADSRAYYDQVKARQDAAVEVKAQELVEIDGHEYIVCLAGRDFSDGIKFRPVLGS